MKLIILKCCETCKYIDIVNSCFDSKYSYIYRCTLEHPLKEVSKENYCDNYSNEEEEKE